MSLGSVGLLKPSWWEMNSRNTGVLGRNGVACWKLLRGRKVVHSCSEVRCESVSHASRTELCYMRRYSALPQVFVRVYACVCERCGLFDKLLSLLLLLLLLWLLLLLLLIIYYYQIFSRSYTRWCRVWEWENVWYYISPAWFASFE